jgi:hypothetical protein
MENIQNRTLKIDEVLEELYFLRHEKESLKVDNDFLDRQNRALKRTCGEQAHRLQLLESEIADRDFVRRCFGPMTETGNSNVRLMENGVNTTLGDDY